MSGGHPRNFPASDQHDSQAALRLLTANAGFNVLALLFTSLIALWLTPFLWRRLGETQFGNWALLGIWLQVGLMADLGQGRALVVDVARSKALGRLATVRIHVGHLLRTFGVLWLMLILPLLVSIPDILPWLGIPASWQARAIPAARLLTLTIPLGGLNLLGTAVLEGLQRIRYSSGAQIGGRLLFAIGAATAALAGWGIVGVAAASLLAQFCQSLLIWAYVWRLLPPAKRSPQAPTPRIPWRFGSHVMVVSLLGLAFSATSKIALARWVNVEAVATYELATVIALQMFALAQALARAIYPALAAAQAAGDLPAVREIYVPALRLQALIMMPVVALLVALAGPFMRLWLGGADAAASQAVQLLGLGWGVASLASVPSFGFWALGRTSWPTRFSAVTFLLNLMLMVWALPRWQLSGVIIANSVAVALSSTLTLWLYHRLLRTHFPVWPIVGWAGVAGLLVWLFSSLWPLITWQIFLSAAVGFGLVYAGGLLVLAYYLPRRMGWLLAAWRQWLSAIKRP